MRLSVMAAGAALLALSACSGHNNSSVNIIDGKPNRPQPQPIRVLSEPEIKTALSGRTFQYTLSQGNGMVTYNADGSLSFQDDAKGAGTGTWMAQEGQLCQTMGKAAQECGEFKNTGDAYQVGKGRLTEMKGE